MFEIKIIEGSDSTSYFLFEPVYVNLKKKIILDDDVEGLGEMFSVEESDVYCFLSYFFDKYFDEKNVYNKNRYEYGIGYIKGFEWHLTHNFFTYQSLQAMLQDIAYAADQLEKDYDNPALDKLKERFSIFCMCSSDSEDYKTGNGQAIRNHVAAVIDFYGRFIRRLTLMMENHPETFLISIMGP